MYVIEIIVKMREFQAFSTDSTENVICVGCYSFAFISLDFTFIVCQSNALLLVSRSDRYTYALKIHHRIARLYCCWLLCCKTKLQISHTHKQKKSLTRTFGNKVKTVISAVPHRKNPIIINVSNGAIYCLCEVFGFDANSHNVAW